jgi:VanZ family protein
MHIGGFSDKAVSLNPEQTHRTEIIMPLSPSQKITRAFVRSIITVIARIALALAISFTLYEATIPHPIPPPRMDYGDKFFHALAFFGLAFLTDLSFPSRRHLLGKVIFLLAFGILIEWIQSFLPWRSADIADFLADCTGIALCMIPAHLIRKAVRHFEG